MKNLGAHHLNNMIIFEKPKNITDTSYFVLTLSNGKEIYQNFESKTKYWEEVKKFLQSQNDLKIVGMRLIGRGKNIVMPTNQNGYFWGNKLIALYPSSLKVEFVGVGYYDGNSVFIRWFDKNNFNRTFTEERTKAKAGFFLIEN